MTAPAIAGRATRSAVRARLPAAWSLGILGLIALMMTAVALGPVAVEVPTTARIVLWHLGADLEPSWSRAEDIIVWDVRLPRVLLGSVVGAALAVSGAALQAMVRNPLADPYVFGISSGASVAAVASLTLGGAFGILPVSLSAFLGALCTAALVFALAWQRGVVDPLRLILAGVAVGYVLSGATTFLVLRASVPGGGVGAVLTWLAGSLARATWPDLTVPATVLALTTVALVGRARALDHISVGDETARGLGTSPGALRLQLFVVTSLLVGVAVAVSGAIGFVGLMIPHAARWLVGPEHRRLLPICALLGAAFVVVVDLACRTVIAPNEVPVGVGTALIGGPAFLVVLRRHRRGAR